MSFGIDKDHSAMQEEIKEACSKDIIMFAAASNKGKNQKVPYPARRSEVLCIYATDGKGNTYNCNPPLLETSAYHFATLGVAVKSAWPERLLPKETQPSDQSGERRMTGTSFATPIVAGIAAYILDFARVHKIDTKSYEMLRRRDGMQEIFAKHMVDTKDSKIDRLDYIHPWLMFADHRSDELILSLIKDTFAPWIGESRSAEVCN